MLVYTCKNKKCRQYLIGGVALCKVLFQGQVASLDVEDSAYLSESGSPLSGNASCYHCRGKATSVNYDPKNLNADHLDQMIGDLDDEIASVMKMMGVDE